MKEEEGKYPLTIFSRRVLTGGKSTDQGAVHD